MIDLIGIILDFLSLKTARRNALKIKRLGKPVVGETTIFHSNLENTFKDYIIVIFPAGEISQNNSEGITWNVINVESIQNIATFKKAHKTNTKLRKMKLSQKFVAEYPSIVLKPNSKQEIRINVNSQKLKRRINFEIAFKRKKLNSTVHINQVKM